MAAGDHLSIPQFHEMTREEFAAHPDVFHHATLSGKIGVHGEPIHVGSYDAAHDAITGRLYTVGRKSPTATNISGGSGENARGHFDSLEDIQKHTALRGGIPQEGGYGSDRDSPRRKAMSKFEGHFPQIHAGTIHGPMWNTPDTLVSDAKANDREVRMHKANIINEGVYYRNDYEDHDSVSAVLPSREHFKTHEDHIIAARAAGKRVPDRVMKQYPHLGQERLF